MKYLQKFENFRHTGFSADSQTVIQKLMTNYYLMTHSDFGDCLTYRFWWEWWHHSLFSALLKTVFCHGTYCFLQFFMKYRANILPLRFFRFYDVAIINNLIQKITIVVLVKPTRDQVNLFLFHPLLQRSLSRGLWSNKNRSKLR